MKKVYGDNKERKKARKWKLKTLDKDIEGENPEHIERYAVQADSSGECKCVGNSIVDSVSAQTWHFNITV